MRKEWLGDDHDVRKYCLLKFLSDIWGNEADLVINWMSTEDDDLIVPEGYNDLVKAIKGFKTINDMNNLLNDNGLRHKSVSTFGSIGNPDTNS